jgi:RHS repeat-associated protein
MHRLGRVVIAACVLAVVAPVAALAQSLTVRSTQFVVDSGDGHGAQPKFLLFISYFDATRAAYLDEDLEYIRNTLRLDGVRIFPNWQDFPPGCPRPSPTTDTLLDANGNVRGDTTPPSGQLERLIQVIRAAAERGLMVDVSFARETVPNLNINDYIKGITRAATLLRPYRNVLFDLQNEHDNASPQQALSIADVLRLRNQIVANGDPAQGDPGRVLVTSGGGTTAGAVAFASATGMHANAFHGSRESNWQDTMSSAVTELLAGNKPVYLQEPQAWDSGLTICNTPDSSRGDRVPGHFRTAARTAKAAGAAAWTFHTRQGFDLRNTSLKSRIQADAVERELLEGTPAVPSLAAEVSATPWPVGVTLTVDLPGAGTGTVTASGGGMTCTGSGVSCSATFSFNETVTLTATPAAGMTFLGWGGACSQAAACTVTVDGDQLVLATFGTVPQLALSFYHLDALGSVRAVTDQTGTLQRWHNYFPFGEGDNPAAGADALRFTAKERDAESGLDYFGARYYAQRTGRFTSVDPVVAVQAALLDPQLWNRYAYVRNNPPRLLDPDGRCLWDLCAAEGATVYLVGAAAVATTAWLVSPAGQNAVRQVASDTHAMITTAAGAIGSWFQTEKRPGTLGKPDHQATVEAEAARIAGTPEVRIETPGGKKDSRRADAVGTNPETGAPEIVQVIRPTPAGNIPKREKDAAADIEKATGVKPVMVPVRPVPPKKPREDDIQ